MDNSGVHTSTMEDAVIPWPFNHIFLDQLGDDSDPVAFDNKWMNCELHFDNQKMTKEMTQQEPATVVSSNPGADNVMTNLGTLVAGPVTPSVLQHIPAIPDRSNFSRSEPMPLYGTNLGPHTLMPDQGHASSSLWAPPAPPQTEVVAVALSAPDMSAPQPQGAIDASCPGSSTGGRKRRVTNVSSTSKTSSVKKPKKWQQTTPCDDPIEERKRQNAIKSYNDRVKKNNEVKAMANLISSLYQENQRQKGTIQRQNETIQELNQKNSLQEQELEKVRQELREEKQKNLALEEKWVEIKPEILINNQELMEQNEILNEFLQQAMLNGIGSDGIETF